MDKPTVEAPIISSMFHVKQSKKEYFNVFLVFFGLLQERFSNTQKQYYICQILWSHSAIFQNHQLHKLWIS